MARTRAIADPRLLGRIAHFYPSRCTIQVQAAGMTLEGEPNGAWSALDSSLHTNIPCAVADTGGQEVRRSDQTVVMEAVKIALRGYYPLVATGLRALMDDGIIYNILAVDRDQFRSQTYLVAEKVSE